MGMGMLLSHVREWGRGSLSFSLSHCLVPVPVLVVVLVGWVTSYVCIDRTDHPRLLAYANANAIRDMSTRPVRSPP